jgi:hypothetical protein
MNGANVPKSYFIKVSAYVDGRSVGGEYSGGGSIGAARKEASDFVSLVKGDPYACVKICRSDSFGRLIVVETVHGI